MSTSDLDRYDKEFKAIALIDTTEGIPDKVHNYTEDVNGNTLPCAYVQLNKQLVHHLNKIPEYPKHKYDYLLLCFGYSGVGKSHTLQRIALYLNASFGLKDIVFTVEEFNDWVDNSKPGDICIFDEADILAAGYYDTILRALIVQSKRIRTKRLIVLMSTPTMKDISPYFIHRARMVIYNYVPRNTHISNRGWVHMWHDQDLIAQLYKLVRQSFSETSVVYAKSHSTLKNKYIGRDVPPDWPINEDAYEAKKEAARRSVERDESQKNVASYKKVLVQNMIAFQKELAEKADFKLTKKKIGKLLNITGSHVSKLESEKKV